MAIDSNDDIYVIDARKKNIVKYDVQGNSLGTINTELVPLSVAINHKDQLFVGDETTGTIYTIASNGSKTCAVAQIMFSITANPKNILIIYHRG